MNRIEAEVCEFINGSEFPTHLGYFLDGSEAARQRSELINYYAYLALDAICPGEDPRFRCRWTSDEIMFDLVHKLKNMREKFGRMELDEAMEILLLDLTTKELLVDGKNRIVAPKLPIRNSFYIKFTNEAKGSVHELLVKYGEVAKVEERVVNAHRRKAKEFGSL